MRKSDFAAELSAEFGTSQKDAKEMLSFIESSVMKAVRSGDEAVLGIGKFQIKRIPARTGRNPATGEQIKIRAKVKPIFKASKKFKDSLC
jgi:DNA-binding protein HU-beta